MIDPCGSAEEFAVGEAKKDHVLGPVRSMVTSNQSGIVTLVGIHQRDLSKGL